MPDCEVKIDWDNNITEAILQIAQAKGWKRYFSFPLRPGASHLVTASREIIWNLESRERYKKVSIGGFVARLMEGPSESPITIGGDEVTFELDGIKVGCVHISRAVIDQIHAKLHERDR